jgi:hypothetical protein
LHGAGHHLAARDRLNQARIAPRNRCRLAAHHDAIDDRVQIVARKPRALVSELRADQFAEQFDLGRLHVSQRQAL